MEREGDTALQLGELTGRREARGGGHEAGGMRHTASGERQGPLRLLFVGRNPLRKGLHHLLMAWNAADKRPGDLLTIVCAAKPLETQRLVEGRNDVLWLDSVSAEELARLYGDSDALVVPSLCEGFGHVYLEAMGHGCAVVGTNNSALPDIGDENQGVFTVGVGAVGELAQVISRASADPFIFRNVGEVARQQAGEFTWGKFHAVLMRWLTGLGRSYNSEVVAETHNR
jgi:glycosyltransferase involved in cell wall biosynthesis